MTFCSRPFYSKCLYSIPLLTIVFCSISAKSESRSNYFEEAHIYYQKQEYAAAAIQLKNALDETPNLLPARILLGKTRLAQSNPAAAEKELNLARRLGADYSLIAEPLGKSLYMQRKYTDILTLIKPAQVNKFQQPVLLEFRGQAFLELGKQAKAEAAFNQARALDPLRSEPIAGLASIALQKGNFEEALVLALDATRLNPDPPSVWIVLASVYQASGKIESARDSYAKAVALDSSHIFARLALAGTLLDLHENDAAEKQLAHLRKVQPDDPRAAFLNALLMQRLGHIEKAESELQAATDVISGIPIETAEQDKSTLYLSALIEFSLGRYEAAEELLKLFTRKVPNMIEPRKLLATIYTQRGDHVNAINTLQAALDYAPNDPQLFSMLGSAYLQYGDHRRAVQILTQAAKLNPDTSTIQTNLAISQLGLGQEDKAFYELTKATNVSAPAPNARVLLAILELKRNHPAEAEKQASLLLQTDPNNHTARNLLASALLHQNKNLEARKEFQHILDSEPDFIPARLNLGKLELHEGHIEQARAHFEQALAVNPKSTQAMLELATLSEHKGQDELALRWLEKARDANPDVAIVAIRMIEFYMQRNNLTGAHKVTREISSQLLDNLEMQIAATRVDIAMGNDAATKAGFLAMIKLAGSNAKQLLGIARMRLSAGDPIGAINTLTNVQGDDDTKFAIQETLAAAHIEAKQYQKAQAILAGLKRDRPNRAETHALAGLNQYHQGHYSAAASAYKRAQELQPNNPELAIQRYHSLANAENAQIATDWLHLWLDTHPESLTPTVALAEAYHQSGNVTDAATYYRQALDINPKLPLILNNLAHIESTSNLQQALQTARKAHAQAPDRPDINDTLGWLLVQTGEDNAALPYLRLAHSRQSQDPEVRYHLAAALANLGRIAEAKEELGAALLNKQPFPGRAEARALQKSISGE